MEIQFLGHAAFALEHDGKTVLVDPFLTGNPKAAVSADEVAADAIFLTHGHGDHIGDTVDIAKRTGATVVAIVELADEIGEEPASRRSTTPTSAAPSTSAGSTVRLTPAWHTSTTPEAAPSTRRPAWSSRSAASGSTTSATPACSATSRCRRKRGHIDVAIIPIGGHYTMDRFDAVVAAELIKADQVIPCHYDTFPPIETDAQAFKADVQNAGYAEVIVLDAGRDATRCMTHAVVLIEAERDALTTLGGELAGLDGRGRGLLA